MTRRRYRHRLATTNPRASLWSEVAIVEGAEAGAPVWWMHWYAKGVRLSPAWQVPAALGAEILENLMPAAEREEVALD